MLGLTLLLPNLLSHEATNFIRFIRPSGSRAIQEKWHETEEEKNKSQRLNGMIYNSSPTRDIRFLKTVKAHHEHGIQEGLITRPKEERSRRDPIH